MYYHTKLFQANPHFLLLLCSFCCCRLQWVILEVFLKIFWMLVSVIVMFLQLLQSLRDDSAKILFQSQNGLLQKSLEEDLCWIIPHVPTTTQSVRGLKWTDCNPFDVATAYWKHFVHLPVCPSVCQPSCPVPLYTTLLSGTWCRKKKSFTIFNAKVTAKAYIIKLWLFLLYLLNCWSVCNRIWFGGTSPQVRVFSGKCWLLQSRWRSQQIFKMSMTVWLYDIFWTTEHFVTQRGMVMQHHEPECHCRTPGLPISWCCLPTSSSVCLVFFPLSLCLARCFFPDLMNGRYDHTTAVCVSFRWSGCLRVVRLPAWSWHELPRW